LAKIFGNSIWLLRTVMLSEWLEFISFMMELLRGMTSFT